MTTEARQTPEPVRYDPNKPQSEADAEARGRTPSVEELEALRVAHRLGNVAGARQALEAAVTHIGEPTPAEIGKQHVADARAVLEANRTGGPFTNHPTAA